MSDSPPFMNRRSVLQAGLALGLLVRSGHAADPLDAIRDKAKAARLDPFQISETATFRGIGDASAGFRTEALNVCEAVAAEYRKHFTRRGFSLTTPRDKMTIIMLSSPAAYAAFEGKAEVEELAGGHYDLGNNCQVIFDFRNRDTSGRVNAERSNTFSLVHETIHQLTFNTGVLDLASDVPVAVSEALATYGETWRPQRRGEIGQKNTLRLTGRTSRWIPLERLLAEDAVFEGATTQDAYAESWMLAAWFLRDTSRVPKFLAYLDAVRKTTDPKQRVNVATQHLGDLSRLDRQLQRSA